MKIDYCFHSHTFRCGHAEGDIEDYVLEAIKCSFIHYGVSDHVFLPGVHQPGTRGDYSLLDDYVEKYHISKAKHSHEIQMYLGFECEYSDHFSDYYRSLLRDKGFDYLICGQHMGFDDNGEAIFYFYHPELELLECLLKYEKDLIKAMECGLFLYIAHPDLLFANATEVTPIYRQITKEIIDKAIENDTVFELNIHGFVRNKGKYIDYPCEYFWKEVAKTNIKVVLGVDYHEVWEIDDKKTIKQLEEFIDKCGIRLSNIDQIYKEYREKVQSILF